jgi:mannose-1-phosphate guanylyltransferase
MQALILVGGEGTRLRPLTSTVPKTVVPLVDRPFIAFMLEWLRGHGIEDVVMSCGFLATGLRDVLGDGSGLGIRLHFVEEPDPRGTAGALKFAESMLDERFVMLNGDILTDIDLTAQIAQHERTGAQATLALVPVEDPTAYGLVHLAEDHSVSDYVEKPSPDQIKRGAAGQGPPGERRTRPQAGESGRAGSPASVGRGGRDLHQSYTNLINAGAYVLERTVLDLVPPDRNVSIEHEVLPLLIGNGFYGFPSQSYWLDIGTPERYLKGTFDIIEGKLYTAVQERMGDGYLMVDPDAQVEGRVVPPAMLERGVRVAAGAHVGSLAVLGQGVSIGAGTTVERAVILPGTEIGEGCTLRDCIVAGGCRVGEGTQITGGAILGEGVTVGAHNTVTNGARIFPGVTIPDGALRFS